MKVPTLQADGLLIDLDGVLYNNKNVIPGAVDAIAELRSRSIPILFVTNTTRMNPISIADHMGDLGFSVSPADILSPPAAAAAYMKSNGLTSYHLLADRELAPAFEGLDADDENPDVVIVGDLGRILTFELIDHAFRLLMSGADLIALHKDRYWQTEQGPRLDTGSMVAALEYSSGKTATVVGKPEKPFFDMAIESIGLSPGSVAMVGDSIETDIGGAKIAGLIGILVRTGNYQYLSEADSEVVPDLIIDSISDLPRYLI